MKGAVSQVSFDRSLPAGEAPPPGVIVAGLETPSQLSRRGRAERAHHLLAQPDSEDCRLRSGQPLHSARYQCRQSLAYRWCISRPHLRAIRSGNEKRRVSPENTFRTPRRETEQAKRDARVSVFGMAASQLNRTWIQILWSALICRSDVQTKRDRAHSQVMSTSQNLQMIHVTSDLVDGQLTPWSRLLWRAVLSRATPSPPLLSKA
jgi:hypothetical protein